MLSNAIIIYSRFGSKRLPGKALKKIGHYKLLEFIIRRLYHLEVNNNFKIIVATTNKREDDNIVDLAKQLNVLFFRGHENDLVNRTSNLIDHFQIDNLCRVNGDCPFVDANLIIYGYNELIKGRKFVSNIITRTYPYGISVEWVEARLYAKMKSYALADEYEHVTKHLYRNLNHIDYKSIENNEDYSRFKFTVDTYDDLSVISNLLGNYEPKEQLQLKYKIFI